MRPQGAGRKRDGEMEKRWEKKMGDKRERQERTSKWKRDKTRKRKR